MAGVQIYLKACAASLLLALCITLTLGLVILSQRLTDAQVQAAAFADSPEPATQAPALPTATAMSSSAQPEVPVHHYLAPEKRLRLFKNPDKVHMAQRSTLLILARNPEDFMTPEPNGQYFINDARASLSFIDLNRESPAAAVFSLDGRYTVQALAVDDSDLRLILALRNSSQIRCVSVSLCGGEALGYMEMMYRLEDVLVAQDPEYKRWYVRIVPPKERTFSSTDPIPENEDQEQPWDDFQFPYFNFGQHGVFGPKPHKHAPRPMPPPKAAPKGE